MPRFPYAPTEGAGLGAGMRGGFGCGAIIVAIIVIGAISTIWENDKAAKRELGPIPLRFQGAYNSISCQSISRHMDGLVTIGDDEIRFPFGSFTPTEVISESDDRITFRGTPATPAGRENADTFTLTRADVGGVALIGGDEYHRCSQYSGE